MCKSGCLLAAVWFLFGFSTIDYSANPAAATRAIETGILWQMNAEGQMAIADMEAVALDENLFEEEGHFYKANTDDIRAFNARVLYLGLMGVESLAGPNAVVEASPLEVAREVSKKYGIKLDQEEGVFVADLNKDVRLLILPHPNIGNATIIIGAYFGR